jgi:hypothetical protein
MMSVEMGVVLCAARVSFIGDGLVCLVTVDGSGSSEGSGGGVSGVDRGRGDDCAGGDERSGGSSSSRCHAATKVVVVAVVAAAVLVEVAMELVVVVLSGW